MLSWSYFVSFHFAPQAAAQNERKKVFAIRSSFPLLYSYEATGQDRHTCADHRNDKKACHIVQFRVQGRMGMAQGNMVNPRNRVIDPQDQAYESDDNTASK